MKPPFYFKNPEFKFIGHSFSLWQFFLLLFYKGTYGHDMDVILIYSSGENNLKTNLKADHNKYRVVNNQLAASYSTASKISVLNGREKAEVYSRNFMTVYPAFYFILKKRVRNRTKNYSDKYFKYAMKGT